MILVFVGRRDVDWTNIIAFERIWKECFQIDSGIERNTDKMYLNGSTSILFSIFFDLLSTFLICIFLFAKIAR